MPDTISGQVRYPGQRTRESVAGHKGKAGRESPPRTGYEALRSVRAPCTRAERVPHRGSPGVACRGDTGVTRQALLLDVEEAFVDEFVDAERTELAAEARALGAAERQVRALACRGVYVGHADLQLLG